MTEKNKLLTIGQFAAMHGFAVSLRRGVLDDYRRLFIEIYFGGTTKKGLHMQPGGSLRAFYKGGWNDSKITCTCHF